MTEKHGSPIETFGDDRKKVRGFGKERVQGVKDSRSQKSEGFKDSRIQVKKDRGLEGWRVGRLAKHLHL